MLSINSNFQQIVEQVLNSYQSPQNSFGSDLTVYRYTRGGQATDSTSPFTLNTVFGFVPVFQEDGSTAIYIRLGGPELIQQKLANEMEAYKTGTGQDLRSPRNEGGFGDNAETFAYKYDYVVDGDDDMNYSIADGFERRFLQDLILNGRSLDFTLIHEVYPMRLFPVDGKFQLQYHISKDSESTYFNMDSEGPLRDFYSDLVDSFANSIIKQESSDSARGLMSTLLSSFTNKDQVIDNVKTLNSLVMGRIAEDLILSADYHILSYDDDALTADNDYDIIFLSAFAQFEQEPHKASIASIFDNVEKTATYIKNVGKDSKIIESVASFLKNYYLIWSVNSVGQEEAYVKDNEELRKKLVEQAKASAEELSSMEQSYESSQSKEMMFTIATGAIVAYLSTLHRDDVSTKERVISAVLGGGLGAIPYVKYATIALSPFLVNKSIDALKSESLGSRVSRIGQNVRSRFPQQQAIDVTPNTLMIEQQ